MLDRTLRANRAIALVSSLTDDELDRMASSVSNEKAKRAKVGRTSTGQLATKEVA